jgi:hypothetical protein
LKNKRVVSAVARVGRVWTEALEQRQLLSVSASSSLLVFNSAVPGTSGGGPSHVDTLTITNSGPGSVTIPSGGITIAADPNAAGESAVSAPGAFSVTNLGSIPSTIAQGQSVTLDVQYTASQTGVMFQSAILQVQTSASTVSTTLHGLGTSGQFGTNEPSLVQILRAFGFSTVVGAGPNDSNFANSQYPINPDASSTEVTMPRLVKAGSGPVTITPLGTFNASAGTTLRFGYYTPGDKNSTSQLFTVGQSDAQTVNPSALGATSFDPGSAPFGLFATFPGIATPNGSPDVHYSESALNTLDASHPQKFRLFPLVNGSAVPNSYVVAAEDFNSTQYNSFTNFVGIISNVMPASDAKSSPVLGISSPASVPGSSTLVFNRIQNLNSNNPAGFVDIIHDTNTVTITNTGDKALSITGLSFFDVNNGTSTPSNGIWQIVGGPSLPTNVAAGASLNLTVKFVATSNPNHSDNQTNDTATTNGVSPVAAGGVWAGQLRVTSNDPVNPTRNVNLAGYWQNTSENENEPGLQTIVNSMFGFGTTINSSVTPQYPNNGSTPVYYGEEVASAYWNVADPTLPVGVTQLDSYHSQFDFTVNPPNPTTAGIFWYPQGSPGSLTQLFRTVTGEGQSMLPYASGGSTSVPASASFNPGGTFGLNLDGEYSQDSLNTTDRNSFGRSGHGVRFFPARDSAGNLIPNTWLVVMDYENTEFDNSDFQDNVYLVTNMHPATQAPAPTNAQAVNVVGGGVSVQWAPVSDNSLSGYNVYRATSVSGPYTKLTGSPVNSISFTDSNPGTGTVYYRVTAVDSAGESEGTNASVVVSQVSPQDVLTSADINSTPAGSTTVVTPGKDYNVVAGGVDIGGTTADGFRFLYEQATGDFDMKVQVNSLTQVIPNTFAGLMARESLTGGSRMVFSGASASDGYRFNYRTDTDATGVFNKAGTVSYPNVWVRLVRQGDTFTGYSSTDGTNWTQTGQVSLSLPTQVYVGIAVASHSTTQTTTAQLRNFNLTGTVVGGGGGNLTPAEQVAADRLALKAAKTQRASQLKAARLQLTTDLKKLAAAKKALAQAIAAARKAHLPTTSVDPALTTAVTADQTTVTQDRTNLATLQKTDFTNIKSLQKTLAADIVTYRKSLHHKA